MSKPASPLKTFFKELRRRKVFRVAVVYAVVGWVIIQVVETIFPRLHLPDWSITLVIVFVIIGFPIAIIVAWALELTPEGVKRIEALEKERIEPLLPDPSVKEPQPSIVVLPFDDISPGKENEYFSDGLTEEIITDLSYVHDLRVISRTTAMMFKGTQKAIKTIAQELNVKYVLEGSVRKAGNDLRITAQLIDATSDAHLWAEKYSGTLDDVFDIQEKVSRSIVDALKLKLSPEEKQKIAERPIENVQAYESYLRARQLPKRKIGIPMISVLGILFILIIGFFVVRSVNRSAKVRWARNHAIPEIMRLLEKTDYMDYTDAYALAREAEKYIPSDSMLIRLWPRFSRYVSIQTEPPGAKVYSKEYRAIHADWEYLGQTPVDSIRFPDGFFRYKFENKGFRNVDAAIEISWAISNIFRKLDEEGKIPAGMVRVPGYKFSPNKVELAHLGTLQIDDYLIDRYEVTNETFKQFVDSGGYEKKEYWKYPFIKEERTISWEEALAEFKDKTGRPGPATWEVSDYPEGQGDYPVSGISWYEAAAYAEFAGKSLPTIHHWNRAATKSASAFIVPLSNYNHTGPAPVGDYEGMSEYGTYDMAGNVREWCWNERSQNQRFILGGGWKHQSYMFNDKYTQPPFDRSPSNGFRCMKYLGPDENLAILKRPIERTYRDYTKEKPVSDEIFKIYLRMYAYDKTELNDAIESVDNSSEDWIREKISFDAAYGGERVPAYLFIPKNVDPPYQTIVFFPGSGDLHTLSSEIAMSYRIRDFDFIIKSGRAFLYPVYKSCYERRDAYSSGKTNQMTNFYKEHVIQWVKDYSRSIDYLETRKDIDTDKLAYYGLSWGGMMGALMPAVENRLKASVVYMVGLGHSRTLPEVDEFNYVSRVKIPTLMLNGRYDHGFTLEHSQIPMFQLLGTPAEHKRLILYETGHFVPRAQLIKETLVWLDRYLGPVK